MKMNEISINNINIDKECLNDEIEENNSYNN